MIRGAAVRLMVTLAIVALGAGVLVVPPVEAELTLRLEPAMVEFSAKPGGTGTQSLTIANNGNETVDLTAAVEPYREASGDHSAVDWLAVEPASFRLEPGQSGTVTVSIAVPDGLASGGRYALVTFTTGTQTVEGSGAAMAGKLGAAFLFNLEGDGDLTRRASLGRFAPVLEPDGRIGFQALLQNDGNLHLFPKGSITVTDEAGTPFGQLEFPATTPLLPASEILLTATGSLPADPGALYRAEATVDFGGDEPVTATVEFRPEALLAVASASVCENLDRGPTLAIDLRNEGTVGLRPHVGLTIREANGDTLGSPMTVPALPLVWPGEGAEIAVDVPSRLVSGDYVLAVRIDYAAPDGEGRVAIPPIEQETAFAIGGLGDTAAPLCPPATA